jgi:GNAT superfamily N-acetyltransferase
MSIFLYPWTYSELYFIDILKLHMPINNSSLTSELDRPLNCEIANATPEDALGICEVRRAVWLDTYVHDDPDPLRTITAEDIEAKDFLSAEKVEFYRVQALNTDNQQILVARDQDRVVGVIVGRTRPEVNTFVFFFMLPEYQGQGIGRELLNKTLGWLGDDKPIEIDVVDYNQKSIDIYKRYGFYISSPPFLDEYAELANGKQLYEVKMIRDATTTV